MTGEPELTLEALLADPLVRAMMKADGVDPQRLAHDLRQVAEQINWQRLAPPPYVPAQCCIYG
jgi:hypothetical protein